MKKIICRWANEHTMLLTNMPPFVALVRTLLGVKQREAMYIHFGETLTLMKTYGVDNREVDYCGSNVRRFDSS